jgi:hypothetical protein
MRAYLTDCPSESFTLRNLGSRLEWWLDQHPQHLGPHTELARDMVRLEWAHIEAFDSEEKRPLGAQAFVRMDEESTLQLQPHVRLLTLSYPVDDLLLQVRTENGSSASSANNASAARKRRHVRHVASLAPKPMHLAVHRHQNTVWYKPLAREEFRLLEGLRDGKPLGEAMELAFASSAVAEDDRPGLLQEVFANWSMLGWFTE